MFFEISPQVNFSNLLTKQDAERHVKDSVRKSKSSPCSSDMIDPTDSLNLTNPIYWPGWRRHVCETRTIFFRLRYILLLFLYRKAHPVFPPNALFGTFCKFSRSAGVLNFHRCCCKILCGRTSLFCPPCGKRIDQLPRRRLFVLSRNVKNEPVKICSLFFSRLPEHWKVMGMAAGHTEN